MYLVEIITRLCVGVFCAYGAVASTVMVVGQDGHTDTREYYLCSYATKVAAEHLLCAGPGPGPGRAREMNHTSHCPWETGRGWGMDTSVDNHKLAGHEDHL